MYLVLSKYSTYAKISMRIDQFEWIKLGLALKITKTWPMSANVVACGFQNGTHSTFSEGKTVTHNSCWPLCYALRVCIFLYHIHIGVPTFTLHQFARYWTWNDYNYNLMSIFCSHSNVLDQKRFFEIQQALFVYFITWNSEKDIQ